MRRRSNLVFGTSVLLAIGGISYHFGYNAGSGDGIASAYATVDRIIDTKLREYKGEADGALKIAEKRAYDNGVDRGIDIIIQSVLDHKPTSILDLCPLDRSLIPDNHFMPPLAPQFKVPI